ncbi:MAG: fibronectin type III domain-containing protein [Candidatus Paceibacterota bacterium]|jgi:hypothetical protein
MKKRSLNMMARKSITALLILSMIVPSLFFDSKNVFAATYTWAQTDYSGGLDGGTYPNHTSNQSNWTKYSAKDATTNVSLSGVTLSAVTSSSTQTTDTDFDAGTFSQITRSGTGNTALVQLSSTSDFPVGTWDTPSSMPDYMGSGCSTYADGYIYTIQGGGSKNLWRYSVAGDSWETRTALPAVSSSSGGNGNSLLYPDSGDFIYFLAGSVSGSKDFWRYSISGNSWINMASTTSSVGEGGSLVYLGSGDYIYATAGNYGPGKQQDFMRYSISGNSWTYMASTTGLMLEGASTAYPGSGDFIYLLGGGSKNFWRYSISGNSWTYLASTTYTVGYGGKLTYPGSGDYLYAFIGNSRYMQRYSISGNSWETRSDTPGKIYYGSSLIYPGSGDYLYGIQGTDTLNPNMWKYKMSTDTWLSLSNTTWRLRGSGASTVYADGNIYVTRGDGYADFGRYSIVGNSWSTMTNTPVFFSYGNAITYPGSGDFIYALAGNVSGGKDFWRYSISLNSWTNMASTTGAVYRGGSLVYPGSGNYIYAFRANTSQDFYRYSIPGNSWENMASSPATYVGAGGSLVYPGSGDYIYATSNGTNFHRYSISGDRWESRANILASVGGGTSLTYPGSGDYIYASRGDSTKTFLRYSITGDSWETLANSPDYTSDGASLLYPNSGNYIYAFQGYTPEFWRYTFTAPYYLSGNFTSSVLDLGQKSLPTTITYTAATTSTAVVKFQIRSASTAEGVTSATWYGPTGTGDYYTSSGETINSIHSTHRYFQYKAFLTTEDTGTTPTLSDVHINYNYYPSSSTFTSSAYNTENTADVPAKIEWSQSTTTNTQVKFQIATAPANGIVPGVFTDFVGPDGTTGTYFAAYGGGETLPSAISDGSNDQWVKYKAYLTSTDTSETPTFTGVTITYAINVAPQFNPNYPTTGIGGVTASENSSGIVTIDYSVRDTDTTSGTTARGYIYPSFEYSIDNGANWASTTHTYLGATDLQNKAVDEVTYSHYQATWDIKSQLPNTYAAQAKIRVTANDREAANNTTASTSAVFEFDTKVPTLGAIPVAINASTSPAVITLSVTDDSYPASSMQMKVGKTADLSDASYVTYSTPVTLSYSNGETIYAKFKDSYGNESSIGSVIPPNKPINIYYQDTSDPTNSAYREFFAWGVVDEPTPGFKRYNVYRSINGGDYALLTTITNREVNYVVDTGLSSSNTYAYKVNAEDNNNNVSLFSSASTVDTPNGVGGSDITSPTLTSIASASVSSNQATITWTSNKLSDSTVYYSATTTYPGENSSSHDEAITVPSMLTSHSVVVSNLTPGTKYYYMVKSTDASSNVGSSASETYSFTTASGPTISNVTVTETYDNEAKVVWTTNTLSSSVVTYSLNSNMTTSTTTNGTDGSTKNHSVTLTDLLPASKYYYYVKSVDAGLNEVTDKNTYDGSIHYYSFVTTSDTTASSITGVSNALIGETGATLAWTTDEPSTSQVEWGTTASLGANTTETTVYTKEHAVTLTNLNSSTKYYYKVKSKDKSDNLATADNSGAMYTFTTLTPTTITSSGSSSSGGRTRDGG